MVLGSPLLHALSGPARARLGWREAGCEGVQPKCHRPLYERQGYACEPTPLLHSDMHTPACRPAARCDIKTGTLNKPLIKRDFISRTRYAE